MPTRALATAALVILMVCGCSDPYDHTIPADMAKWKDDEALKSNIQKLKDDDKEALSRYMVRAGLAQAFGQQASDKTIRDALKAQREFEATRAAQEAEEKALAERVLKEQEAAIAEMNAVLTVAMTKMDFHDADYRNGISDGFTVAFAFENKSTRALSGAKGTIRFADIFDDQIKAVNLSMDEPIAPGGTVTWAGELDYNQFMDADKKLRATASEKLKVSWLPATYLFADGSKMEVPE